MKKIGICTLFTGYNFGSALQAYASKVVVSKMNFEPKVFKISGSLVKGRDVRLNKMLILFTRMMMYSENKFNVVKSFKGNNKSDINETTIKEFNKFYSEKINPDIISYKKLKKVSKNDSYVAFVCGSDQIWNSTAFYVDPFYYLDFCPRGKRIAYAPSFGRTYIPTYNKKIIKKYLNNIDHLSIRENSGKKMIKDLLDRDVVVCLDPTLLLSKNEWKKALDIKKIDENYVFCYFLNEPSENAKNMIHKLEKEKNLKIIFINNPYSFDNVIYGGPETFLTYLSSASYVITDSFHGVAFSINFQKKFYVFDRNYVTENQSTRIKSLLNIIHLDKTFEASNLIDEKYYNFKQVEEILKKEKEKSLNYLKNSIRSCEDVQ